MHTCAKNCSTCWIFGADGTRDEMRWKTHHTLEQFAYTNCHEQARRQRRCAGCARYPFPQEPKRSPYGIVKDLKWYKITWWWYDGQLHAFPEIWESHIWNFFRGKSPQTPLTPRIFGFCMAYHSRIFFFPGCWGRHLPQTNPGYRPEEWQFSWYL